MLKIFLVHDATVNQSLKMPEGLKIFIYNFKPTGTVKDNPIARFPFLSNHQTDLSGLFFTFSEQHYK